MRVFAGTERQCTEDEHDDEDEHDSQISEFGLKLEDRNEHMNSFATSARYAAAESSWNYTMALVIFEEILGSLFVRFPSPLSALKWIGVASV
jgi:hypothetical protein